MPISRRKPAPAKTPLKQTAAAKSYKPALWRMLQIHEQLNRGNPRDHQRINCASLSKIFECSEKTIQRDLEYMRDRLELPVKFDRPTGTYIYTKLGVVFPVGPNLSRDERIALTVARQSLEVFKGVAFGEHLASAYDKLFDGFLKENGLSLEGNMSDYLSVRTPGAGIADPEVFRAVMDTLINCCELRVEYQAKGQPDHQLRRLAPYHLACVASRWVLVARDLEKDNVRTYILARFRNPVVTQTPIERPAQFDATSHLGTSFGVWTGQGQIAVELRISAEGAHHVIERNWHPTQKITPLPHGGVQVRFELSDLNDVTRWILGFGADCEVLSPRELRLAVAAEGRKMAKRNG